PAYGPSGGNQRPNARARATCRTRAGREPRSAPIGPTPRKASRLRLEHGGSKALRLPPTSSRRAPPCALTLLALVRPHPRPPARRDLARVPARLLVAYAYQALKPLVTLEGLALHAASLSRAPWRTLTISWQRPTL